MKKHSVKSCDFTLCLGTVSVRRRIAFVYEYEVNEIFRSTYRSRGLEDLIRLNSHRVNRYTNIIWESSCVAISSESTSSNSIH